MHPTSRLALFPMPCSEGRAEASHGDRMLCAPPLGITEESRPHRAPHPRLSCHLRRPHPRSSSSLRMLTSYNAISGGFRGWHKGGGVTVRPIKDGYLSTHRGLSFHARDARSGPEGLASQAVVLVPVPVGARVSYGAVEANPAASPASRASAGSFALVTLPSAVGGPSGSQKGGSVLMNSLSGRYLSNT